MTGDNTTHGLSTFTVPVGRIEDRDPKDLDEHPVLRVLFPQSEPDEANAELGDSIAVRQYQAVLITGEGCVSPPGTVLDGRRRKLQALRHGKLLRVEVLDDLSVEMEESIVIHSNIAAGLARRLSERQKASLEHRLIQKLGLRQGERTDLTSPEIRGSETHERVAKEMGETRNAVDDRQTVFHSPIASEIAARLVDEGTVKRSPVAKIIRNVQQDPQIAEVLKDARKSDVPVDQLTLNPVIVAAKKRVVTEVEKLLNRKPKMRPPKPVETREAQGVLVNGVAEVSYLGRKTRIEVADSVIRLKDVGAADSDPNVYVSTSPTTRLTWAHDVRAAVDELPTDLRKVVKVGDVECIEAFKCPTCGGTLFRRGIGGCPKCEPVTPAREIQEAARAAWLADNETQELADAWIVEQLQKEGKTAIVSVADLANLCKADLNAWRRKRLDHLDLWYPPIRDFAEAAVKAAVSIDPRIPAATTFVNRRYPRERITVETPNGSFEVSLWECVSDADNHYRGAYPKAGVLVLDQGGRPVCAPISLNVTGDRGVYDSRQSLRNVVQRELLALLRPTNPSASAKVPLGGAPEATGLKEATNPPLPPLEDAPRTDAPVEPATDADILDVLPAGTTLHPVKNSSSETRASASEDDGADANGTDAQQSFVGPPAEGPPRALVKLHELGLLGQAELSKLGALHASHPDEAHLGKFVDDAAKIATTVLEKVPDKATMVELRARLTAGAQSLLREHGPKSPTKARERRLRAAS